MERPQVAPNEVDLVQAEVRDNGDQLLLSRKLQVLGGASGRPGTRPQLPGRCATVAAFLPLSRHRAGPAP